MNSNSKKDFFVKCPRCGLSALYSSENSFRPFCSERCKIIDLGAWAEGKYAIPVQELKYDERLYNQEVEQETDLQQTSAHHLKQEKK